jgi:hypothetical protein
MLEVSPLKRQVNIAFLNKGIILVFLFSIFCCSIDIWLIFLFLHIILHLVPYITKKDISMIFQALNYEHDRVVDDTILGFLSILCPLESITLTKFDYC